MASLDLETDILIKFRKGDDKALALIFKHYHKGLYYFAKQLVHDEQQAEDIVAAAFVKLWQRHGDFNSLSNIKSFLYVTIRNGCYDYLRHIQRKTASHEEILHMAETDENYIESRMIKAELMQIILQEVESLPPIRRKIFKMIYLEDLSIFEIATRLNIKVDTVRVQKARAIHGIRTMILKKGILLAAAFEVLTTYGR
jgi:RNA polymerase sigma-70 factor (family 1)